jgi:type IV pilus assembly protein PilP
MSMTERRSTKAGVLVLAALLGWTLGCGEEAATPTVNDFAAAREASKDTRNAAPKQKVSPVPVERPTRVDPVSGVEQVASDYNYDPTGKRDPFRSFVWDRPDRAEDVAETGPLEQFDLSQLEVVAVVWRTGNARALVEDPSGDSYIVGQGAAIGKNQGRVISIDDNTVVVKEVYVDYLGQETTKDIEMRMRRNEGG